MLCYGRAAKQKYIHGIEERITTYVPWHVPFMSRSLKRLFKREKPKRTDELGLCNRVFKVPGERPPFRPENFRVLETSDYLEKARAYRALTSGEQYEGVSPLVRRKEKF